MKKLIKDILSLLFLNLLIICAGYFVLPAVNLSLFFNEVIILSAFFSITAIITIIIFFRGQSREPQSQTMHTLVSFSLKFLLEMVLALIWFIVVKKTSQVSVLIFFVLYLTFTLFSVLTILKTLKSKSL